LINAVSRNHDQIYSMDPIRFELLVGSVLRDFFDCEVRHVGQTGDGGVDLIAIIGNSRKLIQVKRRSKPDAAESIETVKLMFATTLLERESEAMIVTSANLFTKGAKDVVRNASSIVRDFKMSLFAMADFLKLVDAVAKPNDPSPLSLYEANRRSYHPESEGSIKFSIKNHDGCCVHYLCDNRYWYLFVLKNNLDALHILETRESKECGSNSMYRTLAATAITNRSIGMNAGLEAFPVPDDPMDELASVVSHAQVYN
jgi:hypothetical protein